MFQNRSTLDLQTNVKASMRMSRKPRLIFGILAIVFMLAGIGCIFLTKYVFRDGDYFLTIWLCVFGALLLIYVLFFYELTVKLVSKKMMQGKTSVLNYEFADEGYTMNAEISDGTTSNTQGDYASFTVVREYADVWLFNLNKANVFVVEKSGMTEGTAEDFSAFLKEKLGQKYKVCYKN